MFRFSSPVWLVGFRPFFILAILSACILPLLWAGFFTGVLSTPAAIENPLQWHAHEMFFGFGWAVLGGFLLTASKNWVKIRGLHGGPLALAALAWIFERVSFLTGLRGLALVFASSLSVFVVVGYVVFTLVKHRHNDTFRDNWFFVCALPLLLVSKYALLTPELYAHGWSLTIGIFRLAFLVMLERTTTQFMKNTFKVQLLRFAPLDYAIKGLALVSIFVSFFPLEIGSLLLSALALLIIVRWAAWKPLLGLTNFGIAVMYVGHLAIALHLVFEVCARTGLHAFVGNVPVHTFAFLTMGTIIPAMILRISHGHTGRTIRFTPSDRFAIALIWIGTVFRIALPQIWPAHYNLFIGLSAVLWCTCFALIGIRVIPFLLQPRVDGKVH